VLERALAERAGSTAHRAMLAMAPVLSLRGPYNRYVGLLDATLELGASVDALLQARVLFARARAHQVHGLLHVPRADYPTRPCAAESAGDRGLAARVLIRLTSPELKQGDDAAVRARIEEAMRVSHDVGDTEYEVHAKCRLAGMCIDQERLDEARALYAEALAV